MLEEYSSLIPKLLKSGVEMETVKSTMFQLLSHRGLPGAVSHDLYSVTDWSAPREKVAELTYFFSDHCLFEGCNQLEGMRGWLEFSMPELKITSFYVTPLARGIEDSALLQICPNVRKDRRVTHRDATAILSPTGKLKRQTIGINWGKLMKFRAP